MGFLGEWHPLNRDPTILEEDLAAITKFGKFPETAVFKGLTLFEYQIDYSNDESNFGIFALGLQEIMLTGDNKHVVNCLDTSYLTSVVQNVWMGNGPAHGLCTGNTTIQI